MLRLTCLITSNDLINTGILWKRLFSLTTAQANVVSFVITHLNNITSLKVVAWVSIHSSIWNDDTEPHWCTYIPILVYLHTYIVVPTLVYLLTFIGESTYHIGVPTLVKIHTYIGESTFLHWYTYIGESTYLYWCTYLPIAYRIEDHRCHYKTGPDGWGNGCKRDLWGEAPAS